ncbi:MAG: thiamine-phosphate kinase [Pirellulales bacterium]|nr:thiamine-phosphate kinase [Pirellulales bacterium]
MEQQFIDWLRAHLPPSPLLRVGVGDDAAVLAWAAGRDMVVTTDAVTDQVDFVLAEVEPALVGHKALGVNLSDLAAMAAEPVAAVVSLVLPCRGAGQRDALELAIEIYRGMLPLAERFGLAIAGGDTNTWDGPLAISVTAIGRTTARGPLTRSGARPGDHVLVTGQLGGSILGRHLKVEPRIHEALLLHERYHLHAGMDISDGLALDASRLAAASRCGIALRLADVPISPDAEQLKLKTGRSPLEHAMGDGEDFELLLAAAPEVAEQIVRDQPLGAPITRIGECIDEPGLWQIDDAGQRLALAATGYQH